MAVFNGATKRERKLLLAFFDRLAAHPFMESDCTVDTPPVALTIGSRWAATF